MTELKEKPDIFLKCGFQIMDVSNEVGFEWYTKWLYLEKKFLPTIYDAVNLCI